MNGETTTHITKERLKYLEFLEANAHMIVQNAVQEIIDKEKGRKRKPKQSCKPQPPPCDYAE
jgi:hypothetical protein